MHDKAPCPCGSGNSLAACCAPYHGGRRTPSTAEALMRSRYAAYCLGHADYLQRTWHPSTRPSDLDLAQGASPKWIGLKVLRASNEGTDQATVEFVARYRVGGRAYKLHEVSRFQREGDRWLYVDGDLGAS
jgi:SEC-C motif-containing protein